MKCGTVTEDCSLSDSCIDRVQFELDVAKLLHNCQCVKLLFSALQTDCKWFDSFVTVYIFGSS